MRNKKEYKRNTKTQTKSKSAAKKVSVIPLGGLDRIGMNMTAIRYNDCIIVIDCGIAFPDESMPGVDKVIPDVSYLEDNIDKVKAFIITHGHEDHIGALPYILQQVNVPVYATKLTAGLIEHHLTEAGIREITELICVREGDTVRFGEISTEFIHVNHSIPGACAIAIHTPAGTLFHTGDFKVDYTPLFGTPTDLGRIAEIGREGVLAMLADSTNAIYDGFTPSETVIAERLSNLFTQYSKNRIIVATFSSNIDRVRQVINTAKVFGRKVVLEGRSMETAFEIAAQLGYIKIPARTMISIDEMGKYPDSKLVIITTGSQGEAMAALSRMADDSHKKISVKPGDAIILSSNPIPGNEKSVARIINGLEMKGAQVIYRDTHVSGHACSQELLLLYTLLKPKYAVPLHGEYRHRKANAALAEKTGVPKDCIYILEAGDVLSLSSAGSRIIEHVQAGEVFVDGTGVGDVGNVVLRDRQQLSEGGTVVVSLTIDREEGYIVSGPEIATRGFIYVREAAETLRGMEDAAMTSCERLLKRKTDIAGIRNGIKTDMENYIWDLYGRKPVVMVVIMSI